MIEVLLRAQLTATARDILHANAAHIRYVAVEDARVRSNQHQEDYDASPVEKLSDDNPLTTTSSDGWHASQFVAPPPCTFGRWRERCSFVRATLSESPGKF